MNPAKAPEKAEEGDDDDIDLFGSDEEEEEDPEAVRIREERLAAYREKKAAKPKVAAKSIVTMDVKPWGMWNPPFFFSKKKKRKKKREWTDANVFRR